MNIKLILNKCFFYLFCGVVALSYMSLAWAEPYREAASDSKASGFVIKDITGKKHSLADYKGKWVLVNYWATWCPTCLEELPDLVNLYDARKNKDLMILGVVVQYDSVKEVKKFVDDMLISYPIVLGEDAVLAQIGTANAVPVTFIYNPQGKLVKVKQGAVTKAYLEKVISQK